MMPWWVVKWIHVVSVLGVLGGLLVVQLGLPAPVRHDPTHLRRITRVLSLLLALGLLAGVALYGMRQGHLMRAPFNAVIGFKFLVLLAVGGLLPLSRKAGWGDRLRWIAIAGLVLASLSAYTLYLPGAL